MRELERVLLVEDDADIAELARIGIEGIGELIFTHYASGADALAHIEQDEPDLIVLDYRMPGMNGIEVLAELRTLRGCRDTPVVFMTASVMPQHVARLLGLGAAAVIEKPFDPITLADRLQAIWREQA
ncbi:response regulator [Altericroceibacterium xinjiangense]|uniref:response regulator n=1 Tax=Altericroceibacterium xinjiangense TaxID=762261 RepID=UPI000F7E866F|nr:response regulator [Altericroceibacterium xinjiangense]